MYSIVQRGIWIQQPQHAVGLAPEFFEDSALCFLLNSYDAVNLAQGNPRKVLPAVAPILKAARHGVGIGCASTAQSFLGTDWKAFIATANEVGSGAFSVLKESFESSADRPVSTQFMAREIAVTVDKIERSLGKVNEVRKTYQKKSIMKDGKC